MNCLAVTGRELRSASRRKWTFGLRLLFAGVGAAACLVILAISNLSSAQRGRTMLVVLSFLSLAFCLAAGGFLTADCVSSEKRAGTLGLLLLTPLTGLDIIVGKMVCHGLQIAFGVCAVFPVFFFPLLIGGVTWAEVSRIVLTLGLALLLSGSVGMLISVLGTESRKTILATLSSIALIATVPMIYVIIQETFSALRIPRGGLPQLSPVFTVLAGFDSSYRRSGGPTLFWGSAITLLGLSLFLTVVSGSLVGRVFQAVAPSKTSPKGPRGSHVLADVLDRNPYEWVILNGSGEARSLGISTHILIMFFAVMVVISVTTSHWQAGFSAAFFTALAIHLLTKMRLAVEATRQINTDQRSGAMELLLVTTLPERSILEGHHRALRGISRRPLVLLIGLNLLLELCVILFPRKLRMDFGTAIVFSSVFVGGMVLAAADFAALRWLALFQGLRASNHVKAALLTFSVTMLVPWVGIGIMIAWVSSVQPRAGFFGAAFSAWVGFCLVYDWLVVREVRRRLEGALRRIASEGH